jgi:Cdc6-like AAA superfamily ATPase
MDISTYELNSGDTAFGITDEDIAAFDTGAADALSIIGQERAVRAIALGMGIQAKGYNIYVTGLPGTGKRTAITKILANRAVEKSRLRDLVYVNNFRQPERPLILHFEAGKGRVFKQAMTRLVENMKKALQGRGRKTEVYAAPVIKAEVNALRREFP